MKENIKALLWSILFQAFVLILWSATAVADVNPAEDFEVPPGSDSGNYVVTAPGGEGQIEAAGGSYVTVESDAVFSTPGTAITTRGGSYAVTVEGAAVVRGDSIGINVLYDENVLINHGEITGTESIGLLFGHADADPSESNYNILNNYGSIKGKDAGVGFVGAHNLVTNEATGTITGDGFGVLVGGYENTVVNHEGAAILGTGLDTGGVGVIAFGSQNTIDNSGHIVGTGSDYDSYGIYVISLGEGSGSTIINREGGIISGDIAVSLEDREGSIENYGIIDGVEQGIYVSIWGNNNNIINHATGMIYGGIHMAGSSGNNVSNHGNLYLNDTGTESVITGSYTHHAGATLGISMGDGAPASLLVTETADIQGGTLLVVPLGIIQDGETHTVLTAGTLAGMGFDEATARSMVLTFTMDDVTSPNSLILEARRKSYSDALADAGTPNQSAISNALMPLIGTVIGDMAGVLTFLDSQPTAEALAGAMNQMSPEVYTVGTAMSALSRAGFTGSVTSRLGNLRAAANPFTGSGPAAEKNIWSSWIRGTYTRADQNGNAWFAGYVYDATALNLGMDKTLSDRLALGVSLGLGKATAETHDRLAEIDSDSYQFGLYGSWSAPAFYLDSSVMYSSNKYQSLRRLPAFGLTALGGYSGQDYGVYLGGGYFMAAGTWDLIPTASIQYGYHREKGFTETGAGVLNLLVEKAKSHSLVSKLGVRLSRIFQINTELAIVPEFSLQWIHEFADSDQQATARFSGTTTPFTISGVQARRDSVLAGGSLTALLKKNLSFFLSWEGEYRRDFDAHTWRAGLRFEF